MRLAVAAKRFRSRIREESGLSTLGLSELRLAILIRLRDTGPSTAADLAEAEHVSQQAIAQCLTALKSDELVSSGTDPNDRRKILMSLSGSGRELLDTIRASRDTWLSRAIEAAVDPAERPELDKSIELLERLADIDLTPRHGGQSHPAPTGLRSAENNAENTVAEEDNRSE